MPKTKGKIRRSQKISFCPDCGKRFANETRVLQHMNQPSNACGPWMNASTVRNGAGSRPTQRQGSVYHDEDYQEDTVDDLQPSAGFGFELDENMDANDVHQDTLPAHVIDNHPNSPSTYPGGTTLLDEFFNDKHVDVRREILYYPFASRQDWQLASWLLWLRLSMAAIDEFLSLDLVRATVFILSRLPKLTDT